MDEDVTKKDGDQESTDSKSELDGSEETPFESKVSEFSEKTDGSTRGIRLRDEDQSPFDDKITEKGA